MADANSKDEIMNLLEEPGGPILCFLPCCDTKENCGKIYNGGWGPSINDLPNTLNILLQGRRNMRGSIDQDSIQTSAIRLYTGRMYEAFRDRIGSIVSNIQNGRLKMFLISPCYGILDALEPAQNYNEIMINRPADLWKAIGLDKIIADIILKNELKAVFGYFFGKKSWDDPSMKYRYFFTYGCSMAQYAENTHTSPAAGCFYNDGEPGQWILNALGQTFRSHFDSGFADNFTPQEGVAFESFCRFHNFCMTYILICYHSNGPLKYIWPPISIGVPPYFISSLCK
jgi:hypothetical protein